MPRQLKTFRAHLGFYDTIVAAPSQKKALEAWGSSQNLFHEGVATMTDDPAAVAAANAKPGVVLKRAVGSNVPYSESPALPHVGGCRSISKPRGAARQSKRAVEPEAAPEPPSRGNLDRAEAALAEFQAERARARKSFAEQREALKADEARRERDFRTRERALSATLARAKRDYEKAARGARR